MPLAFRQKGGLADEAESNRSKHHLIVEQRGIPLAAQLGPANQHDSKVFETLIDAIPAVRKGVAGDPVGGPRSFMQTRGMPCEDAGTPAVRAG